MDSLKSNLPSHCLHAKSLARVLHKPVRKQSSFSPGNSPKTEDKLLYNKV